MVHLRTAEMLSGKARAVDAVSIQNQLDRVREVWSAKPPEHPRSVAVADAVALPSPGAAPDAPERQRQRKAPLGTPATSSP